MAADCRLAVVPVAVQVAAAVAEYTLFVVDTLPVVDGTGLECMASAVADANAELCAAEGTKDRDRKTDT